ncbi:hypothetical protein [Moraxella oblonga]|uniref:hypothetical protein n=1 Tax=Moraxella oblonga TaxID=200413 RepID=UPI000830DE62|nr:hypothetical protein [Moraxella oblonga]
MKKYLLLLSIISTTAFANDNLNSFIPKNFRLIESYCQADFNKDGQKDCVLLIKDTKKSAWEKDPFRGMLDKNRRGIIILFKTNAGYTKVLENKAVFASENEDGGIYFAPELYIETKNNKLLINYGHGRYGSWSYTFDYRSINNQQDFYLIGFDSSLGRNHCTEYTQSVNFFTHQFRYQSNTDEYCEKENPIFKTTWHKIPKHPLIKLQQIDDIDEFGHSLSSMLYDISHHDSMDK